MSDKGKEMLEEYTKAIKDLGPDITQEALISLGTVYNMKQNIPSNIILFEIKFWWWTIKELLYMYCFINKDPGHLPFMEE